MRQSALEEAESPTRLLRPKGKKKLALHSQNKAVGDVITAKPARERRPLMISGRPWQRLANLSDERKRRLLPRRHESIGQREAEGNGTLVAMVYEYGARVRGN